MEIVFPDIPEYRFILNGLCSDKLPRFPKFSCESVSRVNNRLNSDVAFVPAPLALINSREYTMIRAGNIFSYFSGPQIFSTDQNYSELFVRRDDHVSSLYVSILLNGITTKVGDGEPCVLEPRIIMLGGTTGKSKADMYNNWSSHAGNLPFPLYVGVIKRSEINLREIVEQAIRSSVKYSLDNSSDVIREIATLYGIENIHMLKRVIFHFINKNTLSISEEEIESLATLGNLMKSKGFDVTDVIY